MLRTHGQAADLLLPCCCPAPCARLRRGGTGRTDVFPFAYGTSPFLPPSFPFPFSCSTLPPARFPLSVARTLPPLAVTPRRPITSANPGLFCRRSFCRGLYLSGVCRGFVLLVALLPGCSFFQHRPLCCGSLGEMAGMLVWLVSRPICSTTPFVVGLFHDYYRPLPGIPLFATPSYLPRVSRRKGGRVTPICSTAPFAAGFQAERRASRPYLQHCPLCPGFPEENAGVFSLFETPPLERVGMFFAGFGLIVSRPAVPWEWGCPRPYPGREGCRDSSPRLQRNSNVPVSLAGG